MSASPATLCAIAAMARNRVIGRGNALIWHIPADLKHFKRVTMGKPVIMGRKSFESLKKPLPGRANIVVSRSFSAQGDNVHVRPSIDEAIRAAQDIAARTGQDAIFIIGGGEIYRQTLPAIRRLYLTVIDRDYDGDTFFPDFDWKEWNLKSEENHPGDPGFAFFVLERAGAFSD